MENQAFTAEFEFKASPKMLFPYLNTTAGLAQWFADDVYMKDNKVFVFYWNGEEHLAKITGQRHNSYVKFEFLNNSESAREEGEPNFIELKIDYNELTDTVYLIVTDQSMIEDYEELYEIWENLTENLKEIIGG